VTERVTGLASRHGAAPGANCVEPSNAGVQDRLVASPVATNQPSKITAKGSSLSLSLSLSLHTANGKPVLTNR
jgi:hypothetical protein